MKILAVSDEECPALWDNYVAGRLADYDLMISCGDLKAEYLSFLVTMGRAPLLYVHGNHDQLYLNRPPEGCDCIDDRLLVYNGLRILGLGGCRKYHPGPFQYTEGQMRRRIRRLSLALRRSGGVDIVVCHAPPLGLGDRDDPAHWGFEALRELVDKYHPPILLHGHVHLRYNLDLARELEYQGTRIINASERFVLELPDRDVAPRDKGRLLWKSPPPRKDRRLEEERGPYIL